MKYYTTFSGKCKGDFFVGAGIFPIFPKKPPIPQSVGAKACGIFEKRANGCAIMGGDKAMNGKINLFYFPQIRVHVLALPLHEKLHFLHYLIEKLSFVREKSRK